MITFDNDVILARMFRNDGGTWTGISWYPTIHTGVFDYFRDNAAVNDAIYFGWDYGVWHNLQINVGTPLVASSISVVWEYMDAATSTWRPLTAIDPSDTFRNAGAHTIFFDVPDNWRAWGPGTVSTGRTGTASQYIACYIRCRITAVSGMTEGGANTADQVMCNDWAVLLDGGTRTPADILAANDAGGWGVMSRHGDHFLLASNLRIGDAYTTISGSATNATTLSLQSCILQVGTPEKNRVIVKKGNTTLQLGTKTGDRTHAGAMLLYYNQDTTHPFNGGYNSWYGEMYLYSSQINKLRGGVTDPQVSCAHDTYNSQFGIIGSALLGSKFWYFLSGSGTIKDTFVQQDSPTLYLYSPADFDNLMLNGVTLCIIGISTAVKNINFSQMAANGVRSANINVRVYTENCTYDNPDTQLLCGSANNRISALFNLELDVIDERGNALTDYTVEIKDANGTDHSFAPLNRNFDLWRGGDAEVPDYWRHVGGPLVKETAITKVGPYSVKLSRITAATYLFADVHAQLKGMVYWAGKTVTVGCWVKTNTVNGAHVLLSDGTGSTGSGQHPGDNEWHYLTCTRTINSAGSILQLQMHVSTNNTTAYFDGVELLVNGEKVRPSLVTNEKWLTAPTTESFIFNPFEIWVRKQGFETHYRKFTLDNTTRKMQIKLRHSPTPGRDDMGPAFR